MKPQKRAGTCWKWSMAGPVTEASNRNELPTGGARCIMPQQSDGGGLGRQTVDGGVEQ